MMVPRYPSPRLPRECDEWADYDGPMGGVGSVSTLTSVDPEDAKPLPRAFPPGFHVAAPGPSREDAPVKPRKRKA